MKIFVDVIVPVHNAEETIEETVKSAMSQSVPAYLLSSGGGDDDPSTTPCCDKSSVLDKYKRHPLNDVTIDIAICCHNDGSTDSSLDLLYKLCDYKKEHNNEKQCENNRFKINTKILIGSNDDGIAKGAGAARNRAASLRSQQCPVGNMDKQLYFLCLLDSDDVMHPHRIAHQVSVMMALVTEERNATLLGTTFDRIPKDSTWHYTHWANNLKDERLMLERFRELTILQPTWMMTKQRFELLGGYIESSELGGDALSRKKEVECNSVYKLIHPKYDTEQSLKLAEDLRIFHAHLSYPYGTECSTEHRSGTLKLIRTVEPLLSYRHREGQSQSSLTPRKLLLQLRTKAFADTIILRNEKWTKGGFIIWGAGRDGKDFFKALPEDLKECVRAFVDVDEKKIASGYYSMAKEIESTIGQEKSEKKQKKKRECYKIPLVHFSLIANDDDKRKELIEIWVNGRGDDEISGRITKQKHFNEKVQLCEEDIALPQKRRGDVDSITATAKKRPKKDVVNTDMIEKDILSKLLQRKVHAIPKKDVVNTDMIEKNILSKLPVVVCVAMNRTNGVLEANVKNIGRQEGINLWHLS